ncbi:transmembrane protein C16orf54 homolog [Erinaceus europaeus]|uniref:Transmembrane protein C16orf54 homolog n=1 Tax=Erinaceus europaeus TaxID=9365 RepID=A0A1S3AJX4_ERIEU|nr:transmembrane protein C16orf54 homolog [Erinaceus europaeus]XP_016049383.1 transmembrane protein C16orf54 homolog [Erinaceus europaeus]
MPSTAALPPGPLEGATAEEPEPWPPLPCGPCVPIMLALGCLAALFLVATAVLAERLFRSSLRSPPGSRPPTLVWRPGGELWIEPSGSPRERSEDWYSSAVPLLTEGSPAPPTPGGTLEARATAPPALPAPKPPPVPPKPAVQSTFWGAQAWEERPPAPGLVSWAEPEQRLEVGGYVGSPPPQRLRPGSPDVEWGLQPRVTQEQISAFWKREGRTRVGL